MVLIRLGAQTAAANDPAVRRFVEAAVTGLAAQGQARVDRMALGERAIAAAITLTAGDTAWFWKIAYNEGVARFSPGVQLVYELTPNLAVQPGIARIDSCATAFPRRCVLVPAAPAFHGPGGLEEGESCYASACFTRSGVNGSARRRLPVACAIALAMAAAAGPCEPSPTPRKRSLGRSSNTTWTSGTSSKRRI